MVGQQWLTYSSTFEYISTPCSSYTRGSNDGLRRTNTLVVLLSGATVRAGGPPEWALPGYGGH